MASKKDSFSTNEAVNFVSVDDDSASDLLVFLGSRRLYIGKLPQDFRNGFTTPCGNLIKHFHDVYNVIRG